MRAVGFRVCMSFARRNLLVLLSKLSCFTKTTIAGLSVFRSIKGAFFDDYDTSVFFPPVVQRQIANMNLDVVHIFTPSQIGLLGVRAANNRFLTAFSLGNRLRKPHHRLCLRKDTAL